MTNMEYSWKTKSSSIVPLVGERVRAPSSHIVLLEDEDPLPHLGEEGGHGEAADAATDHDGVQVGGNLILRKDFLCVLLLHLLCT